MEPTSSLFLHALSGKGLERLLPGLDRIQVALAKQGLPWDGEKTALVVGSNGKGSSCFFLSEILRQSGATCLTFLSPHVRSPNERFLIQGEPVSLNLLDKATAHLQTTLGETWKQLSYFEFLVALLPLLRKDLRADWVVMEAGLGGTWDATNTLPHRYVALTGIARDHVEILGRRAEERLVDKLGVVGEGTKVWLGPLSKSLHALAVKTIRARGGVLISPGSQSGLKLDHDYPPLVTAAGLAHDMAQTLLPTSTNFRLTRTLPARAAWYDLGKNKFLLIDGAHNDQAAKAIGSYMRQKAGHGKVLLVFSLLGRKDAPAVVRQLSQTLLPENVLIPGTFANDWLGGENHAPEYLQKLFQARGFSADLSESAADLLQTIQHHPGPVLVTGSFRLAGAFMDWWETYNGAGDAHHLEQFRSRPHP